MTQRERLNYLVERFKEDSGEYRDLAARDNDEEKRRVLRSLMNIRMPLDLCAENALRSVAFCCISTGVFRFPKDRAAQIAVQTVIDWLAAHEGQMERVIFNVFSDGDRRLYEQELGSVKGRAL